MIKGRSDRHLLEVLGPQTFDYLGVEGKLKNENQPFEQLFGNIELSKCFLISAIDAPTRNEINLQHLGTAAKMFSDLGT